jgi:hypothetical protein
MALAIPFQNYTIPADIHQPIASDPFAKAITLTIENGSLGSTSENQPLQSRQLLHMLRPIP